MSGILLCASDYDLLGSLERWLKGGGYDTIAFSSAEEAVSKTFARMPRLAVVEVWQFDPPSFLAARRIYSRFAIPIIIVASSCYPDTLNRAADAGIAAMLLKPLREEDFLAAVTLALAATRRAETLKSEVRVLKESIERKKVVEQAKGRLMERDGLTEAEAFRKIQKLAMDKGKTMRRISEILLTDLLRLPDRHKTEIKPRRMPKARSAKNSG